MMMRREDQESFGTRLFYYTTEKERSMLYQYFLCYLNGFNRKASKKY